MGIDGSEPTVDEADDERLRDAYRELYTWVTASVEVDRGLGHLYDRATARRRARRSLAAAVAVAATVAVIGTAVAIGRSTAGDDVVADRGPSRGASRVTTPTDECDLARGARIYLQPTATDEQVATVRAVLVASGDRRPDFVDRDAAYREFRELFSEQPDLLAVTRAEDLPTSFRVSEPDVAGRIDWSAVRSLPGVLRVEPLARGCARAPAGGDDVPSVVTDVMPPACPTRPGLVELGTFLPARFDAVPRPGAGEGWGIGGPCTRHWVVPGDPGSHVTAFGPDSGVTVSSLGGTVVETANLEGWVWGRLEGGLWLGDPSGRFVVVGYGVDEAEWRALIEELIKQP